MRREVVLTGLGLLAGTGLGLIVGRHWPATPARVAAGGVVAPPGANNSGATSASPASGPTDTADAANTDKASPAELRQRLDRWLTAGGEMAQMNEAQEWLLQWSEKDPNAALAYVHNAPRFPQRNAALGIAVAAIAKTNPAGALAWLTANLPAADARGVAESAIGRIGHDFPREALQLGFNAKFSVEPYWASDLLGSLARTDPQEALGYFARLNHEGRDQSVGPLVASWYAADRAGALQWCDSQRDTAHFNQAARALIQTVSAEHPADFDALVKALKLTPTQLAEIGQNLDWNTPDQALVFMPYLAPADTQRVMSSVLDEQLPLDPAGAVKFARDVLPADKAPATIAQAWSSWLTSDRKAALAWAESVSDPVIQAKLQDVIRGQRAENEPQAFLADYEKQGAAFGATPEQLTTALNTLARNDTAAAARWITEHPQAAPASAIGEVISNWMNQDATAAFAWVQQLPAGAGQDRAVRSAVEHWVNHQQFDLATQAITSIRDPQRQTTMRMRVFMGIADKDRAEAVRWLDTQPVHPEARASWISMMQELHEDDTPGD